MARTGEHDRLIAAAAKAALKPLGFARQGRSRFWFADQRFWIVFADFQPSSWSKGSYLNVGTKWLWEPKLSLDISERHLDFIPFESKEQFSPLIARMADVAAQETLKLKARFTSLDDICRYLIAHASRDGWPVYHAAIASGLLGDFETSNRLFDRIKDWPTDGYDWQMELKSHSASLAALVPYREDFKSAIVAKITLCRRNLKMPPDTNCLDFSRSSGEP